MEVCSTINVIKLYYSLNQLSPSNKYSTYIFQSFEKWFLIIVEITDFQHAGILQLTSVNIFCKAINRNFTISFLKKVLHADFIGRERSDGFINRRESQEKIIDPEFPQILRRIIENQIGTYFIRCSTLNFRKCANFLIGILFMIPGSFRYIIRRSVRTICLPF